MYLVFPVTILSIKNAIPTTALFYTDIVINISWYVVCQCNEINSMCWQLIEYNCQMIIIMSLLYYLQINQFQINFAFS